MGIWEQSHWSTYLDGCQMDCVWHAPETCPSGIEVNPFSGCSGLDSIDHRVIVGCIVQHESKYLQGNSYHRLLNSELKRTHPAFNPILLQGLPHGFSHILTRMLTNKLLKTNHKFSLK